ncbi:acyltransferase family protein [Aeromicrobium choanae]|uniref:Peptidoglycan/LPS O-acetylase OafA/YrhL, contains acyltransferase and SGNH-hydrolase domains n=1 Tax=Aeromicrobium choanae TaxID=1736691 RepID=A0A1T4YN08_9ACTN|nr:acyltransferase family protein [Aeromicrobium choanae]SKB03152.1 Peptidoglycan/LPS O-acetylase OafA/YrhL, contains acyltransferase and SGNH-hydrolase domains [Aeromicrobium choanae]
MSAPVPSTRARLPYRPALDGLRAVAIAGVLVFHLDERALPGGWLGVDLFFVLSGFLITNLLVFERERWGRISVVRFWGARMRRLLPSLVTVLLAVSVAAWIWTVPGRRTAVAWDIVSSLFYVSNWRFMLGDEQYFDQLSIPSPVRHTWSLSIEEQFYIVFPLLLIAVGLVVRKRRGQALVFAVLALASAAAMATGYANGTEITTLYYSTVTRAFELLIGVCAALFLGHAAFRERRSPVLTDVTAWAGLAVVVAAMVGLDSESGIVFRGGLVVICLAALVAILAAASGTNGTFTKVLGSPVPRWIGLISYPLYLWHWPIIVFVHEGVVGLDGLALDAVRVGLSVLLAWLTYRFIEGPVRGRRPFFGSARGFSRAVAVLAAPLVVASAFVVAHSEPPQGELSGYALKPGQKPLKLTPDPYTAEARRSTMLLGNSIPYSLYRNVATHEFRQLSMSQTTHLGCDPFALQKRVDGETTEPTRSCLEWRDEWPALVSAQQPDVLLFFVPQTFLSDLVKGDEVAEFGSPEHERLVREALDEVDRKGGDAGKLALSTLACHDIPAFDKVEMQQLNDIERVERVNAIATAWAAENDVPVIDSYAALCPNGYQPLLGNDPLYEDGLHFTNESAPHVWAWMMPQVLRFADAVHGEAS